MSPQKQVFNKSSSQIIAQKTSSLIISQDEDKLSNQIRKSIQNKKPLPDQIYQCSIQTLTKLIVKVKQQQLVYYLQADIQKRCETAKKSKKSMNPKQPKSQKYLIDENDNIIKKFQQLKQFIDNYVRWSQVHYDQITSNIYKKLVQLKTQRQTIKNSKLSITQRLKQLYQLKSVVISKICQQNRFSNNSKPKQDSQSQKLLKLSELDEMINEEIQQAKKQFIQPFSLKQFFQSKQEDIFRQVNFYLVVAWIISFLLASKDNSVCISQPIIGQNFTFRIWLWTDGGITSLAAICLLIFSVFSDNNKNNDSNNKQNSSTLKYCFMVLACFIILAKIGWVFFGIILFLNKLHFYMEDGYCSDDVVTYCSLQFVAFFMLIMSFIVKLIETIAECCARKKHLSFYQGISYEFISDKQMDKQKNTAQNKLFMNAQYQKVQLLQDQIVYDTSKHDLLCNKKEQKQKRAYLGIAKSDFQDLCQKFFTWTLLGWVYGFVLWKKDHSQCLDMDIPFSFKFRKWLLIDASASIAFYGYLLIIMVVKIFYNSNILMLYWEKYQLYQFQIRWFTENRKRKVLGFLLVIQFLFKFVWMLVGVVIFCFYLQDCKNSNTLSNYLVFYFTQAMYVVYETTTSIIRGYNHKLHIKKNYERSDYQIKEKEQTEKNNNSKMTNNNSKNVNYNSGQTHQSRDLSINIMKSFKDSKMQR